MSLGRNVIANYLGQGWRALVSLAFVPLYIKYLGMEAYGLIGVFAILQGWLTLLDMGMTPALGREMARFTAGAHNVQTIRDLLRSLETMGFSIAAATALVIWSCSPWLATGWLRSQHLPAQVIAHALTAMGIVTGLRFVENIYTSSVIGLERQVQQNIVTSSMATLRAGGAVVVLAFYSPTIEAFFLWQCFVSLITIPVLGALVYTKLPAAARRARFSLSALGNVWRFAAGMMAITTLALLLTQVDKVLLSRLLSLEEFGYYALAGVMVNTLYILAAPVSAAFYPRFTVLATRKDEPGFGAAYHQSSQIVTVVAGAAAVMLIVFGHRLLLLWTANISLTSHVAPLLGVLAAGTLLNSLMGIPYQAQLAHGWTSLTIKINIIAVVFLIPAIFFVAPRYGVMGAAWVWVLLNSGYLIFDIYFMHRRILRQEKWGWYGHDVLAPLVGAFSAAFMCRWLLPQGSARWTELIVLSISAVAVITAAGLAARTIRHQFARFMRISLFPGK